MTDPWNLKDEQFWAELDTAAVEDDFTASRREELLAHFRVHVGRPLVPSELAEVEQLFQTWERALRAMAAMRAFSVSLCATVQKFVELLAAMPAPRFWTGTDTGRPSRQERRTFRAERAAKHRPQPRTLHLALEHNVRPVHRQRAVRGQRRSPASRRR